MPGCGTWKAWRAGGRARKQALEGTFRDAGSSAVSYSFELGIGGKGLTMQSDNAQWWLILWESAPR